MLDAQTVLRQLKQAKPLDSHESSDLLTAQRLLGEQARFWQADNGGHHLTASCWILNPNNSAILLLHHRKLNRWLQPGGHIEADDDNWLEAALREAREETGIDEFKLLKDGIFDFDIHTIPARGAIPEHQHFDARFLLQAQTAKLRVSAESNDLRWFSPDKAAVVLGGDPVMERMLEKTRLFLSPDHQRRS